MSRRGLPGKCMAILLVVVLLFNHHIDFFASTPRLPPSPFTCCFKSEALQIRPVWWKRPTLFVSRSYYRIVMRLRPTTPADYSVEDYTHLGADIPFTGERLLQHIRGTVSPIAFPLAQNVWRWVEIATGLKSPNQVYEETIRPRVDKVVAEALSQDVPSDKPLLVLRIGGEAGAGKTTFCNWLVDHENARLSVAHPTLPQPMAVLLSFDNYLIPEHLRPIDPETARYSERPEHKFETERFYRDFLTLLDGREIHHPVFNVTTRLRVQKADGQGELLMPLSAKGRILVVDGIGSLGPNVFDEKDIQMFMDGDYDALKLRLLQRMALHTIHAETERQFVDRRDMLRLIEEVPWIYPNKQYATHVASALELPEALYVLYRRGRLDNPTPEIAGACKELGLDLQTLVADLHYVYNSRVEARHFAHPFIGYAESDTFVTFFDDRNLAITTPRSGSEKAFNKRLISFYERILKRRLGGYMVPGSIIEPRHLELPVDNTYGRKKKVLVQSKVPTLRVRLEKISTQLAAARQWGQADRIHTLLAESRSLLDSFFETQAALWRRGIFDSDPDLLDKYGTMITDGKEHVVLIGIDNLQSSPPHASYESDAAFFISNVFRIREAGIDSAIIDDFESHLNDFEHRSPFHDPFGCDIEIATAVPEVADWDIGRQQLALIQDRVWRAHIVIAQRGFLQLLQRRPATDGTPPLFYWIHLLAEAVYSRFSAEYQALEKTLEEITTGTEGALQNMRRMDSKQQTAWVNSVLDVVMAQNPSLRLDEASLYRLKMGISFFNSRLERARQIQIIPRLWDFFIPHGSRSAILGGGVKKYIVVVVIVTLLEVPLIPALPLRLWIAFSTWASGYHAVLSTMMSSLWIYLVVGAAILMASLVITFMHGFPKIPGTWFSKSKWTRWYRELHRLHPQTAQQWRVRFVGASLISWIGFSAVLSTSIAGWLAGAQPIAEYVFPDWLAGYAPSWVPALLAHMAWNLGMGLAGHPEYWLSLPHAFLASRAA